MKMLVVDDSRNERKIIRFSFECHGYCVIEAANGRQGLEMAQLERPDLILSDTLMPVMDGFQFLYELKSTPGLAHIPFIFFSAPYTGAREEELALAMGARAFIRKPKNPDELYEEVGRVMASVTAGTARVSQQKCERALVENYSQMVAAKLEEQVRELSEVNRNIMKLNCELEKRVLDRTAQLEEANSELEMFSYSVSHDLRAPLRHLDGFSQVLLEEYETKLNANGKEYLERIRRSSRRMWQMIDALVEFSRATRGRMVRESVNLSVLAREICSELAKSEPERRANFLIEDEVTGWGDARMLRVVLEHLLGNAWKFTGIRKEAVIEFFQKRDEEKNVYGVRDNGAGFDMSYADKLFAPFQKLHRKEDFPGCGIGLATVRRILNRHNGKIWFESEPGMGAAFYFTL